MFSGLMPKRKEFFDLLIAHSDRVVASANATLRLVNNLGTDSGEEEAGTDRPPSKRQAWARL